MGLILKSLGLFILAIYHINLTYGLNNGLALTPPMGWLTWERFRCNIDCDNDPANCIGERLIKEQADRMVDDGYLDVGYEYIIIDDCWLAPKRDENSGRLQPDPKRFPNGIKALVDYVHSKGLKFGIYEDYGFLTCAGYPGSIENLQLDAETFAEWGVDYLKFDGCYSNAVLMDLGYPLMSDYLNKTNRSIVYSCEWPLYQVVSHMKPDYKRISKYCNLWRNYYDVDDNFDSVYSIIDHYAKEQGELEKFQGPGGWNDPDMLTIGNFGLTIGQSKTQMAMWAIFSAPLIMSTDLRSIEPWAKEILQNKILITINQDPDGKFGKKFLETKGVEVWRKHSSNYSYTAFVMLNAAKNPTPTNVNVTLIDLGLVNYQYYNFYEAFSGEFIGTFNLRDSFNATVNPYGGSFVFWAEPTRLNKKNKLFSSL